MYGCYVFESRHGGCRPYGRVGLWTATTSSRCWTTAVIGESSHRRTHYCAALTSWRVGVPEAGGKGTQAAMRLPVSSMPERLRPLAEDGPTFKYGKSSIERLPQGLNLSPRQVSYSAE